MLNSCEHIEPLLSAYIDDELDAPQRSEVKCHLAECERCTRELDELRGVVNAAERLAAPSVDDEVWDAFLGNVYNRLERRLGWMLLMLGALLVAGFMLYEAVVMDWPSPVVKAVCAVPLAGIGLLFVSVLRQRLHVARGDRYSRNVRH